jgi:hypothetical protein
MNLIKSVSKDIPQSAEYNKTTTLICFLRLCKAQINEQKYGGC